jgi:hypothetical protein
MRKDEEGSWGSVSHRKVSQMWGSGSVPGVNCRSCFGTQKEVALKTLCLVSKNPIINRVSPVKILLDFRT